MKNSFKKELSLSNDNKLKYALLYILLGVVAFFIWYIFWLETSEGKGLTLFIDDIAGQFAVASFFFTIFGVVLTSLNWQYDIFNRINNQQKEKIRILSDFAQEHWYSTERTIYNELLNMLERCSENQDTGYKLYMLMCSPTLDYPERIKNDYLKWGNELRNKIETMMPDNNDKLYLNLYHLPNDNISGVNPLREFIESLSGFCAALPGNTVHCKSIFENIYNVTEEFIRAFQIKSSLNPNIKISSVEQPDVPFQIFIYESKKYSEVLVSFAGKSILQDKNETKQKGFHSTDPDVVNAFKHIFKAYTENHRRIPIKPIHSLDIIEDLAKAKEHSISNYVDLGITLKVNEGIFSPAYANSSKFTSYAITKILKKDDKVLDIGSGTGAQAIVSYNFLKNNLLTNEPIVWAIEPFKESFENLNFNINQNSATITSKQWLLYTGNHLCSAKNHKFETGKLIDYNEFLNGTEQQISLNDFNNIKFNIVIGDLPYVDTSADIPLEHAFFDLDHNAHKSLFQLFAKETYFANDAKLITSFSSLGGIDDIIKFERIISKNNLVILQRFAFNEKEYLWYVYVIVKKSCFDTYRSNYWWTSLNAIATS